MFHLTLSFQSVLYVSAEYVKVKMRLVKDKSKAIFYLFYVLQDCVLKIAYGRSKRKEKRKVYNVPFLVLQTTEHLKRNVQTSIVPFLQNILMQQY